MAGFVACNKNKLYLIKNSKAVQKDATPEKVIVKKGQSRNGCDGRLMENILVTTI